MIVKRYSSVALGAPVPEVAATVALPSGSVGLVPGNYVFNGKGFDCTQPGLYRFWNGGAGAIQSRLVYTASGLYEFLAGVSWHHAHGVEDEGSYQTIANNGMTHKWRLRCGYIAGLMVWFLPQWWSYFGLTGMQARVVNVKTTGPLNGIDDGHIVFEVFHEGKWKMWDITNGVYFTLAGVHLSTAEIITAGILNCERVHLDVDEKYGASLAGNLCLGSYADLVLRAPEDVDAWFARIFQSWAVG